MASLIGAKVSEAKWDDAYFVGAYELACAGFDESHMATSFGMSEKAMRDWVKKKPALADAIARGRRRFADPRNYNAFRDYAYGRLPEHLQELWDRIDLCDQTDNGVLRCKHLIEKAGETARMHFYLYALVHTGFNVNKACKKLGLSKRIIDLWTNTRPDFAELVDELHWHKKNFCESALLDKINEGDSALIWNVNRTLNADRGYKEKTEHVVSGNVNVNHKVTTLPSEVVKALPGEVAVALWQALREARKEQPRRMVEDVGQMGDRQGEGDTSGALAGILGRRLDGPSEEEQQDK